MQPAAQRSADDSHKGVEPPATARRDHPAVEKIVPLFTGSGGQDADPGRAGEAATEQDWSGTIDRVRRVAAQVRQTGVRTGDGSPGA